ncbi:MAG TPA: Gfo/Idh/MocA family oxidoreductase, partial [Pirellulales bacterium]
MKLRVGLVGLGKTWEVRHRPALRALADRFEVRAVCDQVAQRAEQAAREFNATAVDGFRALAAREDVDAILMLAEQWYGWLPILAACESGKAIYCAAPLQLSLEEARKIKDRVDLAGVAFMAEFARRQNPATLRLKELIATKLGQPRLLFCHRRVAVGERPIKPDGPKDRGFGTSDLVELVDWCRYVVGREPTSVLGMMHSVSPDSADEDYRMMSLDFSSSDQHAGKGVVAQISSGYYMPQGWEEAVSFRPPPALQVSCEHGIAFIDLPAQVLWFDKAGRHQESLDSERAVGEMLLSHFHRSVTSLVRNPAGLEDAYRALVVV